MIHFLIKTSYIWLIGFFLAILEIQIEGEHGWAEKLPTWRAKSGSKMEKIFKKIMSDKDLTGYHVILNTFLLLFLHLSFIWSGQWDIWQELELLSIYVMLAVFWDFLWFVLNPKLSLRKFGSERVWWHKKWLGIFPTDYYTGILLGLLLLLPAALTFGGMSWYKLPVLLGVNLILTILTVAIYPKAY